MYITGLPYGDDNNDIYSNDDYEDVAQSGNGDSMTGGEQVIHTLPHFITTGQNMLVNEGSTIKLPCLVNRLGKRPVTYLSNESTVRGKSFQTCTFLIDTVLSLKGRLKGTQGVKRQMAAVWIIESKSLQEN